MKLLVKYGKAGQARFASHRDFARSFERAIRRARIPMAYSSGFSPHPRISYINPAPTGVASVAEYLVIALSQTCDPATIATCLNQATPAGFEIIDVTDCPADLRFEASLWLVELPGTSQEGIKRAVEQFLAAPECLVSRETKNGLRTFDTRAAVIGLEFSPPGPDEDAGRLRLTMVIRHMEPLVRADDVITALRRIADLPEMSTQITRLEQGKLASLLSDIR